MNKHIKIIIIQAFFLVIVLTAIYFVYPRTILKLEGNLVNFKSMNADVIIISENPDFSNPKYFVIKENLSIELEPGTYYWKPSNKIIQGLANKIVIESEVGMEIKKEENESELVNIGNVKINVTKNKEGIMVGHIILEPEEREEIEDKENVNYTGRQTK